MLRFVWNYDNSSCFFHCFEILIFWIVSGVKGQKMVHISGTLHHMIVMYGVHVLNGNISRYFFFIVSKSWFSRLWGGERAKNDPKWQKNMSVTSYISGPYVIWSSFMVHICKRIISPYIFFIFSKFWFSGSLGGWKVKKWPKMTKHSVSLTPYLWNCTSYDCHFWDTCVKW